MTKENGSEFFCASDLPPISRRGIHLEQPTTTTAATTNYSTWSSSFTITNNRKRHFVGGGCLLGGRPKVQQQQQPLLRLTPCWSSLYCSLLLSCSKYWFVVDVVVVVVVHFEWNLFKFFSFLPVPFAPDGLMRRSYTLPSNLSRICFSFSRMLVLACDPLPWAKQLPITKYYQNTMKMIESIFF